MVISRFRDYMGRVTELPKTVVVGAGPVGMAVARGLIGRGIQVLLLDAGPRVSVSGHTTSAGTVSNDSFTGLSKRGRGLGGGTSQWAGQCLRFHSADFDRRPWVAESGWPFGLDELLPYYSQAESFVGVSADEYHVGLWRKFGLQDERFIDRDMHIRFSAFTPNPRIFERDQLWWARSNQAVVLHDAEVVELIRRDERVSHIRVSDRVGHISTIDVEEVILCVGAIETARLLLAAPTGGSAESLIRNEHVGRHLQDHPNGKIGEIMLASPSGGRDLIEYFSMFYRGRRKFLPRWVMSPRLQEERGVLNACAIPIFRFGEDSMTESLRRMQAAVAGRQSPAHVLADTKDLLRRPASLYGLLKARRSGHAFAEVPLGVEVRGYVEQSPSTSSRVTLSSDVDSQGRALPHIEWSVAEAERHALVELADALDGFLDRLRIGRLTTEPSLLLSVDEWGKTVSDNQHHVGTARMSSSPAQGVVDSEGRVWGLRNLYVSGGAIMPTGSHANPTLTMVALGFRTAASVARTRQMSCT